jgi:hypothetical protein
MYRLYLWPGILQGLLPSLTAICPNILPTVGHLLLPVPAASSMQYAEETIAMPLAARRLQHYDVLYLLCSDSAASIVLH